jgi:hypothetical protein
MADQDESTEPKRRTGVDNSAPIDNKARHPWAGKIARVECAARGSMLAKSSILLKVRRFSATPQGAATGLIRPKG